MMKKVCFVKGCLNNSVDNSNKLFITVPLKADIRLKWYHAVNKREDPTRTCHMYCCEDHFDLPNDVENWTYFKMFGSKMMMKKNVVPHVFPKKEEKESQFSEQDKELKRKLLEEYEQNSAESKKSNVEESQFSEQDKELKRKLLEQYEQNTKRQNVEKPYVEMFNVEKFNYERLNCKRPNIAKPVIPVSDYSLETAVVDTDKKILLQLKSRGHNIKSQFLIHSQNNASEDNTTNSELDNETIVPSRLNIHLEPDLPELLLIRDKPQIQKHQPLLLRRKSNVKKVKEVVWVNPPLVEVSNEILEKQKSNIMEEKLERLKNAENLPRKPEFVCVKEEINEDDNFEPKDISQHFLLNAGISVQPELSVDMHQLPDSVQAFLKVESDEEITSEIVIKEEPAEEAEDFEFVNVNAKSDSHFFHEDPLKVSGTNIFVVNQKEESILG